MLPREKEEIVFDPLWSLEIVELPHLLDAAEVSRVNGESMPEDQVMHCLSAVKSVLSDAV